MNLKKFDAYITKLMNPNNIPVADHRANGLQVSTHDEVKKIALGVDVSLEFMKKAKGAGCDTLITHHGINFEYIENSIPAPRLNKLLDYSYKNNFNIFGFHYLMDCHKEIGHNAQIIKFLNFEISEPAGIGPGQAWGWSGYIEKPIHIDKLFANANALFEGNAKLAKFGPENINKIIVISGSGSASLFEAFQNEAQAFITGEVKESVYEEARELGINLIWGGHYITEKFGLLALKEKLDKENIESVFIDVANPL